MPWLRIINICIHRGIVLINCLLNHLLFNYLHVFILHNQFIFKTSHLFTSQMSTTSFHSLVCSHPCAMWKGILLFKRIVYCFVYSNVYLVNERSYHFYISCQAISSQMIKAMPKDASIIRCHKRCIVTSRARGLLKRWRISRFVFRHLADYNYLSGVKRACW